MGLKTGLYEALQQKIADGDLDRGFHGANGYVGLVGGRRYWFVYQERCAPQAFLRQGDARYEYNALYHMLYVPAINDDVAKDCWHDWGDWHFRPARPRRGVRQSWVIECRKCHGEIGRYQSRAKEAFGRPTQAEIDDLDLSKRDYDTWMRSMLRRSQARGETA